MFFIRKPLPAAWALLAALGLTATARADAVTDWNSKAGEIIDAAGVGPATARRAMAAVQTAVYGAVNAITQRYPPGGMEPGSELGGSIDAAVATGTHDVLAKLFPTQKPAIDAAWQTAMARVPDGKSRKSGVAAGRKSAAAILAIREADLAEPADDYKLPTMPEGHVQMAASELKTGPSRTPWLMPAVAAFRPPPPPAESSTTWARDYNEAKNFGGTASTRRTPEQTVIAQFWEDDSPMIFYGVVRSVANQAEREVTQNARLYMAVAQAVDDATMAVMDAKYAYQFWRPVDAVHFADRDDNPYTEPDAAWKPLGPASRSPEYPCARCIEAAAVAATLKAEIGDGPTPPLTTTSRTAPDVTRSWTSVEDMMREVNDARVFAGADFRTSTLVALDMGTKIGKLAASQILALAPNP
jgi:hypothetical protein